MFYILTYAVYAFRTLLRSGYRQSRRFRSPAETTHLGLTLSVYGFHSIFIIPSGCVPRRRTFSSLARVPLSLVSFSSSFASLMFVSFFYFPLVFVSPWFCWFHGFVRFPGFPVSSETPRQFVELVKSYF